MMMMIHLGNLGVASFFGANQSKSKGILWKLFDTKLAPSLKFGNDKHSPISIKCNVLALALRTN